MELQIFNSPEFGGVRVVTVDGEARFCLSDVCKILELDASQVVKRLDGGVVTIHPITDSLGRIQNANFVNEDGLYDTILDSRKPEAKRFRKWITAEVLPSIRKRGVYINPLAPIDPEFLRRIADEIDRRNKKIAVLETQLAELEPKASYYDIVLQCKDLVPVSQIAKDYGYSAKNFNRLLHELGVQFNQGGVWLLYQKYARRGWTSTKTHKFMGGDYRIHCRVQTYWTQKGRLGLYDLLKRSNHLPTVEKFEEES